MQLANHIAYKYQPKTKKFPKHCLTFAATECESCHENNNQMIQTQHRIFLTFCVNIAQEQISERSFGECQETFCRFVRIVLPKFIRCLGDVQEIVQIVQPFGDVCLETWEIFRKNRDDQEMFSMPLRDVKRVLRDCQQMFERCLANA